MKNVYCLGSRDAGNHLVVARLQALWAGTWRTPSTHRTATFLLCRREPCSPPLPAVWLAHSSHSFQQWHRDNAAFSPGSIHIPPTWWLPPSPRAAAVLFSHLQGPRQLTPSAFPFLQAPHQVRFGMNLWGKPSLSERLWQSLSNCNDADPRHLTDLSKRWLINRSRLRRTVGLSRYHEK